MTDIVLKKNLLFSASLFLFKGKKNPALFQLNDPQIKNQDH